MKKLEVPFYLIIVVFFIMKYASSPADTPRDRRPSLRKVPVITAPRITPRPNPNTPLPSDIQNVTVEIDNTKKNSVGTGFAFDGNGQYITARHVTEGCKSVYVLTAARKGKLAQVNAMRNSDFSVLNTRGLSAPHVEISDRKPRRGDNGFFLGYPQGNPADVWAVAYGKTHMRSVGRYKMREPVTAWVERRRAPDFSGSLGGMSGGPAFSEKGEIVGTVVAGQPRRGRVFTTDISNFDRFSALNRSKSNRRVTPTLTTNNFAAIGKDLRKKLTIAKIYCKV